MEIIGTADVASDIFAFQEHGMGRFPLAIPVKYIQQNVVLNLTVNDRRRMQDKQTAPSRYQGVNNGWWPRQTEPAWKPRKAESTRRQLQTATCYAHTANVDGGGNGAVDHQCNIKNTATDSWDDCAWQSGYCLTGAHSD